MRSTLMASLNLGSWIKNFAEAIPGAIITVLTVIGLMTAFNFTKIEVIGENNNVEVNTPRVATGEPCPVGWVLTRGTEPDSSKPFISCASVNKQYMITIYRDETGATSHLGYDLSAGRQLTKVEIEEFYK